MPIDYTAIEELAVSHHLDETRKRDNSYIRVSGIGDCRRKIAYRILWHQGEQDEPRIWTHGLTVFELGHGLHLKLQERLSNVGPLKWVDAEPTIDEEGKFGWAGNCEIPLIDHEYRLKGTLDDLSRPLRRVTKEVKGEIIEFIEPTDEDDPMGKRYIIDIKTITARDRLVMEEDGNGRVVKSEMKPSSFERLVAPKPEHVQQVSLYSWLTTRPEFKTDRIPGPLDKMPDIMIIYVAKDLDPQYYERHPEQFSDPKGVLNSPYKVFVQPTDKRVVNTILKKVGAVWSALDSGELPPRDYNWTPSRPDWHCTDCSFRHHCYDEEGYFSEEAYEEPIRLIERLKTLPK